jgi:hypothetical protein
MAAGPKIKSDMTNRFLTYAFLLMLYTFFVSYRNKLFFIWRDQYSLWCSTGFCLWSYYLFFIYLTFVSYTSHSTTLVIIFMLMTPKYTVTWHHPANHLIFLIFRTVYRIFRNGWIVSNLNLIQENRIYSFLFWSHA